jgi:F-type H+-transporting ATPase subunit delta
MAAETLQLTQTVEEVYAAALLELAQAGSGGSSADDVREQMDDIAQLVRTDPGLQKLLSSMVLSTTERSASIQRIFEGRVSDLVYRFLQVVNSKDRLGDLLAIATAFGQLVDRCNGILKVDAYVAASMDDAQLQRVTTDLGQALGGTVVLHQYVDPTLIGGIKLRIGDKLIDASVASQLRKMKEKIVAAGRDSLRGNAGKFLGE